MSEQEIARLEKRIGRLRRKIREDIVMLSVLVAILYVTTSLLVFGLRHPWMTDTELFLHTPEAMCWGSVDYDDVRRRGR